MSFLMFAAGILAAVIGVVLIAAGVPVKEFSFGNTLILAGTVAAAAGLIAIGLGAVIGQLQRIADMLGTRPAGRGARAIEPFDQAGRSGQGASRIPFPPKPKPAQADPVQIDASSPEVAAEQAHEEPMEFAFAPRLPNPDEAMAHAEADEAPLMPRGSQFGARSSHEFTEPARPAPASALGPSDSSAERLTNPLDSGWRAPASPPRPSPQPNYFDAMWPNERPTEPRSARPATSEDKPMRSEPAMRETVNRESVLRESAEPKRADADSQPPSPAASETLAVPILKSGVIDGMGYTLFVDGSIEAELPHGTLRFGSIGELREHLEKRS